MDRQDTILNMLSLLSNDIRELSERVTRLEERVSWRANTTGIIAGGIPSLAALAYIWLS